MSWRRTEMIALALIVVVLGGMIAVSRRDDAGILAEQRPEFVTHSSYSTYPSGYKALYLTMQALGYTAHRQIRPLALLPKRGLLIIADPSRKKMSLYEAKQLRAWVRQGNYVLLMVEHHRESLYALGGVVESPPNPYNPKQHEEKKFVWWDNDLVQSAAGQVSAKPVLPSFLSEAAAAITVESSIRFPTKQLLPNKVINATGVPVPLYRDREGAHLLFTPMGKGGIVWCNSPWMLSNAGISKPGNLEVVVRLAELQPGTPVIFDEYHQGYGAGMSVWTLMPSLAKFGAATLVLALVLLLFTVSWRFGTARLPAEERFSRTRAEYLTSMSAVLERAGATHVVRDRTLVLLRRELGRRLGVSPHAPLGKFIEANRHGMAVDQAALERLVRHFEAVSQQRLPAGDVMLRLVRETHALLKR